MIKIADDIKPQDPAVSAIECARRCMVLEGEIATLRRHVADARKLIERLKDECRWRAFCAALGGYNANPNLGQWTPDMTMKAAKEDADAAVRAMCDEPKPSPAVEAWRRETGVAREEVYSTMRRIVEWEGDARGGGWAPEAEAIEAAIDVLREAEVGGG